MRQVRNWVVGLAVCLLAGGCSLAKFGYDAFPMWAMWELDSYLSMNDDQSELARRTIDQLQAWHMRQELPRYVGFLREVDARLQKGDEAPEPLQVDDVRRWREQLLAAWPPVVDQLTAPVTQLLTGLEPDQVVRLRGKIDDANRKMFKKYKLDSPKGMVEARGERIIDRTEFFLGRLSTEQKRSIREQAAALPVDETRMYADRLRRQQALLALIERLQRERPPAAQGERWTRDYLLTVFVSQDPKLREYLDTSQQASDVMTTRVLNEATPEQRTTLSRTLRDFAADFDKRAKSAGG